MASTQKLTQLPTIQYTGMDYSSVINQIRNIIEGNKNWKENWTEFYNSEAGTMLIQLMAYICDNLAVRQDVLYNEQFLSTATSNFAKINLLNQIGYTQRTSSAAIVPITVEFDSIQNSNIVISGAESNKNARSIVNNIKSFTSKDINGKNINWEILAVKDDNTIDYQEKILLQQGRSYYTKYSTPETSSSSSNVEKNITAVQGKTNYKEFTSDTTDGPIFDLGVSDFDIGSFAVFQGQQLHTRVKSFMDLVESKYKDDNIPCYILEKSATGNYQIRYISDSLANENNIYKNHQFKINGNDKTISVLYRTCNGKDGNIPSKYINTKISMTNPSGKIVDMNITNEFAAYNGSNAEELNDAILNAPLTIKSMDRCVTTEDFDRILKRCDNFRIDTCKTFTPSNEPIEKNDSFKEYYGRKINPMEAFSFIVPSGSLNGIKDEDLNKYPFLFTKKQNILNEKYSFGNAKLNEQFDYDSIAYGLIINDSYDTKKDSEADPDGSKWSEKCQIGEEKRLLKNAKIFKTSSSLGDTITKEKSDNTDYLKAKIQFEQQSNSNYVDNIVNFNDYNGHFITKDETTNYDSTNNILLFKTKEISEKINSKYYYRNFVKNFVNATATSARYFSNDEIMPKGNFTVVFDDLFTMKVNRGETTRTYYGVEKIYQTFEISDENNEKIIIADETRQPFLMFNGKILNFYDTIEKEFGDESSSIYHYIKREPKHNHYYCGDTTYRFMGLTEYFSFEYTDDPGKNYIISENLESITKQTNEDGNPFSKDDLKKFYKIKINDTNYKFAISPYVVWEALHFNKVIDGTDNSEIVSDNHAYLKGKGFTFTNSYEENLTELCFGQTYQYMHIDISVLSRVLRYLFSPLNTEEGIIWYYDNNGWVDLHDPEQNKGQLVLNGLFNVKVIKRKHFSYNGMSNRYFDESNFKTTGEDDPYIYDYDLLFEYNHYLDKSIQNNDKNLQISSCTTDSGIYDFIETIIGYKKKYETAKPITLTKDFIEIIDSDEKGLENNFKLRFKSLSTGYDSSVYIISEDKSNIMNDFGGSFKRVRGDIYKSEKAFGVRRVEMYVGDSSKDNAYTNSGITLNVGDFIITDSDLNFYNIPDTVYTSYCLSNSNRIELGSQSNIIYSYDENINNNWKEKNKIYDIEGAVYNKKGELDKEKSKFDVRLTKNYQEKSSLYTIKPDQDLGINHPDYVRVRITNTEDNNISISDEKNKNLVTKSKVTNIILEIDEKEYSFANFNFNKNNFKIEDLYNWLIINYPDLENIMILTPDRNMIKLRNRNEQKGSIVVKEQSGSTIDSMTFSNNADYYIEKDDKTNTYYMVKPENSNFPDTEFYVHFINDKVANPSNDNIETYKDEVVLDEYMNKYKIAGTKIHYLQPYFKIIDLQGIIQYNTNYELSTIKENINAVLDKYTINNISNIQIGNKIYASDIIKELYNVPGIEHINNFYMNYSGKSAQEKNCLYGGFNTIILLAQTEKVNPTKGILFTYEIDEASKAKIN